MMTLADCIRKARNGDPLGECFRRNCWNDGIFLCIEEISNSWHERAGETPENSDFGHDYIAAIEDVVACDWTYAGSMRGGASDE